VGTLQRESVALDAWILRQLIPACNIIAGQVDYSPQAKTTLRPPGNVTVLLTTSPPLDSVTAIARPNLVITWEVLGSGAFRYTLNIRERFATP
jgi:hypothetical protein